MKKGEYLIGNEGRYLILNNFEVTGGMSKVAFAKLDDKEYFIKEFLSPKYPVDITKSGSPATIEKRKKKCEDFEKHHKSLNTKIATKSGIGGNLVCAFDFFRSGSTYYKVAEKIDISSVSISEISEMPIDKVLLIMKTVTSSLKILHDLDIVHGDIKPDNVLIKKTETGAYTTKLIDFDNSYFTGKPPENTDETVGDQIFYSPELAKYIMGKPDIKAIDLTTQSDVFALGVLFCMYMTGNKPNIGEYKYTWQSVISGNKPKVRSTKFSTHLINLVDEMLNIDASKRPNLAKVFEILKSKDSAGKFEEKIEKIEKIGGGLKGKLISSEGKSISVKSDETPALKGKLISK